MIETKILKLNEAEVKFHWGKTIVSTEPTTGVGNEKEVGFLSDEVWNKGIDPNLAEYEKEHPDEEIFEWDCHTRYLGFIQAEDGKYDTDPDEPCSVVWSDWAGGTYSILKSPYVQFCEPCSPCCPGQVSLGQLGNYLGFSPSIEDFDEEDTDIPEVWVYDLMYEYKAVEKYLQSVYEIIHKHGATSSCAKELDIVYKCITYMEALSTAHAENQKNTEQRILVKQMRIE